MKSKKFKVVIVGMGPAGMAAALELAELGIHTAVFDEGQEAGGQIYRRPSDDFVLTNVDFLGPKFEKGRKLLARFESLRDKINIFNEAYIWGFFNGDTLSLNCRGENSLITYDKLLLAEGAMERSVPFPGWTLPGIMTLGGLQKLIVQDRLLPGRRFLLAGCSPLLLPVASALLDAGAEIVGLCNSITTRAQMKLIPQLIHQKGLAREVATYFFQTVKRSVPSFRPYIVISASGEDRVEQVTIAKLDKDWKPVPGSEKRFRVDILGVSYGFLPLGRLTRLCGCTHTYDSIQAYWKVETDDTMRTSIPDIYAAGDSAGINGADMAEVEGRIAAGHIAAELGKLSSGDLKNRLKELHKVRNRIRGYTSILNEVFSVKPGLYSIMNGKTVVCRCEQVTVEEILTGINEFGYCNINEIKRTRAGMGLCQGRTCESITTHLLTQHGVPIDEIGYMGLRPPLSPMPFSSFESWTESEN